MPFILDIRNGFDPGQLDEQYAAVNAERMTIRQQNDETMDITILYGTDPDSGKRITIRGTKPVLWIKSYINQNGTEIYFAPVDQPDLLKYDNDRQSIYITNSNIELLFDLLNQNSSLHPLVNPPDPLLRNGFLLSVMIASEAVRNQLIRTVISKFAGSDNYMYELNNWNNYKNCYRNWNTCSKALYGADCRYIEIDVIDRYFAQNAQPPEQDNGTNQLLRSMREIYQQLIDTVA